MYLSNPLNSKTTVGASAERSSVSEYRLLSVLNKKCGCTCDFSNSSCAVKPACCASCLACCSRYQYLKSFMAMAIPQIFNVANTACRNTRGSSKASRKWYVVVSMNLMYKAEIPKTGTRKTNSQMNFRFRIYRGIRKYRELYTINM